MRVPKGGFSFSAPGLTILGDRRWRDLHNVDISIFRDVDRVSIFDYNDGELIILCFIMPAR